MAQALKRGGASGPIAILPWSDVIEDFLDHLGVSLQRFAAEMSGGWLFGYVAALQRAGVGSLIVVFSRRARHPERLLHRSTGAPIMVLPTSRAYDRVRKVVQNPYGWSKAEMFGDPRGWRRLPYGMLRPFVPYLATPLWRLARLLRDERCSAILCQEYEYGRFESAVLLGQLLRVPVVASFQGGTSPHSWLERRVRPLSLRLATGLVIGSREEAQRVARVYGVPPTKIKHIPNPLETEVWSEGHRDVVRAELGVENDDVVVAWHGRIDIRRKGLDVLLDAWDTVVDRRPNRRLTLLLVGTGRDAPQLRRRLERSRERSVIWVDEYVLDKRQIARYLAAADLYAFPSRIEGFPVAPLEAMASALPIVAADAPGVAEILGADEHWGGVVVPPGDPAAFASALGELLDQPERRRQLSRCARQRVEAFSLDTVGQQLAELFR